MWVKGHNGHQGNEQADNKAKETVMVGRRMHKPGIEIPGGTKQSPQTHNNPRHIQ